MNQGKNLRFLNRLIDDGVLILVAGHVQSGKTSLAVDLIKDIGLNNKQSIAMFSLDENEESISLRMLSSITGINTGKLKTGKLNNEELLKLKETQGALTKSNIFIDDSKELTAHQLLERSKSIKDDYKDLSLIVLDCVQLLKTFDSADDKERLDKTMGVLKLITSELKIPVVAFYQLAPESLDTDELVIKEWADGIVVLREEDEEEREKISKSIRRSIQSFKDEVKRVEQEFKS